MSDYAAEHEITVVSEKKLRVLMLCAHDPSVDPRIRWEAESASANFEVTILGFNRDDASKPANETVGLYRIVRLTHSPVSSMRYLWMLGQLLVPLQRLVLILAGVIIMPALWGVEQASRVARGLARRALRLIRLNAAKQSVDPGMIKTLRGNLIARLLFIAAIGRTQFAPAAQFFWRYVQQCEPKPDVVHCNDLDTLIVGALAKRYYGCRVVYDAHEYFPMSDPDGRALDTKFFSLIEQFLIRRADACVTVNPLLAEVMRGAYGLEKIYSVPNAEPWIADRVGLVAPSRMAEFAAGRVRFLFQGRFTPGRGISEMIDGWSGVDGTRAALFLRGPDNLWRQAEMQRARRAGTLDRSVYFLDAVTEEELIPAAQEAHVGIIPYRPLIINDRLSCPNKLSQYLHAGLMVVANDLPYVASVLKQADAGISYCLDDASSSAEAITSILNDPTRLEQCRQNALRFARETFNWQHYAEAFENIYRNRLGSLEETIPAGPGVCLQANSPAIP